MTNKHQTNIAGEWRVGDTLMRKMTHDTYRIVEFQKDKVKIIYVKPFIVCQPCICVLNRHRKDFINISELARATGRVI